MKTHNEDQDEIDAEVLSKEVFDQMCSDAINEIKSEKSKVEKDSKSDFTHPAASKKSLVDKVHIEQPNHNQKKPRRVQPEDPDADEELDQHHLPSENDILKEFRKVQQENLEKTAKDYRNYLEDQKQPRDFVDNRGEDYYLDPDNEEEEEDPYQRRDPQTEEAYNDYNPQPHARHDIHDYSSPP